MKTSFLIFIFILFLGHNVTLGQDNNEDSEAENMQKEMQDQRAQYQAILKAVGGEGVENDPDFQKMVKEGIKDPQQMLKKLQEIRQKNGKDTNIGKLGSGGNAKGMKMADLLKGNASHMVKLMIQQFAHVPPQQIKDRLLAANEGKPQGKFLKNNPKFLDFVVNAFKHPNALPNFAKILDQRKKLTYFVGVNIFIFFFGMWFKRVQKNRNRDKSATKSMNQFVIRTVFLFGLRISVFVAFFHNEVNDIFGVAKNSFL